MKTVTTTKQTPKTSVPGKQYNYTELIEYLDSHWVEELKDTTLSCMQHLDKAFGLVSKKVRSIFITGSNGKSLTAYFTAHLLKQEGLKVGIFSSPHILTYNERLMINDEAINNKVFTDLGNEVVNMAATLGLTPYAQDILTMMALLYFERNNIDVALLEVTEFSPNKSGIYLHAYYYRNYPNY